MDHDLSQPDPRKPVITETVASNEMPFTWCPACCGNGGRFSDLTESFHQCSRCDGTGRIYKAA